MSILEPQAQQQPQKVPEGAKGEAPEVKKEAAEPPKKVVTETRQDQFLLGIGANAKPIERTVPADEPPPLAPNAKLKHLGKRVPRIDGRAKVTGGARYPSDINLPGMLHGRLVNASVPHGRITSLDVSAAEKHPGVRAVYVLESVDGNAELKDKSKELPSKYPIIRYAGQPVAAIAAVTPQAAEEATRLVKIEYETLPFVLDLQQARQPNAPLVFPGAAEQGGSEGGGGGAAGVPQNGNVRGPATSPRGRRGDVQKGFAEAAAVVQGDYRTQVQTHAALETHGVVADYRDDGLTVYASTQGTLSVRDELAAIFKLPKSKVRVLTEYMGGGFGAKFGAGNAGVAAAQLSRKAGAPVRLFCDRKEEHWGTGNRPDSWQRIRIGAGKDGKLTALQLTSYGTAGVGTGAGTAGPAQALYACPNLLTEEYDVFINAGPGAAFRAPGHPQGCFALEQAMDELAEKLNLDVLELMDRNDLSEERREERRIGAEKFGWAQKRRKPNSDTGPVKRGVGVAQSVWYRINNMDSGAEVRIGRDGSVEVLSAVQDIGGGIKTVLAQVVAEELGIEPRQVTVRAGDTNSPPGPPSGGSMTTGSLTPAVRNAAYKAKLKLAEAIAPSLGGSAQQVEMSGGKVFLRGKEAAALTFRQAAGKLRVEQVSAQAMRSPEYGPRAQMFLGGVQFAEVAVDTETGIVKVERVLAVHDCGRPMNLTQVESQVNGGILQGISYALYEDRRLDRNTGIMVNANLEQYKIIGAVETPPIEVHVIEDYLARSSTDAGGIGEPATIPTSAAIANAIYNALGVRMRELPITPARVLAALGRIPGQAAGGAQ